MSKLHSGPHTIVSKLADQPVGRHGIENPDTSPKQVISHATGVAPQMWILEEAGDGRFRLLISKGPTTVIDDKIYALVVDEGSAISWSLNHQPQHGIDVFTIEQGLEGGWILPSEVPGTQIAFGPLIVQPSEPPRYSDHQLWVIRPIFE